MLCSLTSVKTSLVFENSLSWDAKTAITHAAVPYRIAEDHVTCDVGRFTAEEWNALIKLERRECLSTACKGSMNLLSWLKMADIEFLSCLIARASRSNSSPSSCPQIYMTCRWSKTRLSTWSVSSWSDLDMLKWWLTSKTPTWQKPFQTSLWLSLSKRSKGKDLEKGGKALMKIRPHLLAKNWLHNESLRSLVWIS